MNLPTMLKQPSAFLPLVCSAAALATVLGYLALFGPVQQADEGAAARLFQLLLLAEVPIIGYFAISWLPRAPRQAIPVLGLQLLGIGAALAPIIYFEW